MRVLKGLFRCGQLRRKNERQPKHEVTGTINKLKEKLPFALLSVTDLAYFVDTCVPDDDQEQEEGKAFISEWTEEHDD